MPMAKSKMPMPLRITNGGSTWFIPVPSRNKLRILSARMVRGKNLITEIIKSGKLW